MQSFKRSPYAHFWYCWTKGVHLLRQIFICLIQIQIKISSWNFQHSIIIFLSYLIRKMLSIAQSACLFWKLHFWIISMNKDYRYFLMSRFRPSWKLLFLNDEEHLRNSSLSLNPVIVVYVVVVVFVVVAPFMNFYAVKINSK